MGSLMMKIFRILALVASFAIICPEEAHAYSLWVTTCDEVYGETSDRDLISFGFCAGGSYCDISDLTKAVPAAANIDVPGAEIEIPVSLGDTPTTVEFSTTGSDAWCIAEVRFDNGENLLGLDGKFYLDSQTDCGENTGCGCVEGVSATEKEFPCSDSWKFFNINNSSDYMYDVRIKACPGTKSSSVVAYFCSVSACDGGLIGAEERKLLEMDDVDGGWTDISLTLPFNPFAVRLEDADDGWCADELTFNAYSVDMDDLLTTGSHIFTNLQDNGQGGPPTPSPVATPAPASPDEGNAKWLDAAWEVVVTVIGGAVLAVCSWCVVRACRRARPVWESSRHSKAHPGEAEGSSTADADRQNGHPDFS